MLGRIAFAGALMVAACATPTPARPAERAKPPGERLATEGKFAKPPPPAEPTDAPPKAADVPEVIPRSLANAALELDTLLPTYLDSTKVGGRPNPDGRANVSKSRVGSVSFKLRIGRDPLFLEAIDLFVRPVTPSGKQAQNAPKANRCGGSNTSFDTWKPRGPAQAIKSNAPIANHAVWNLSAAAGDELDVYFNVLADQLPSGHFTYVIRLAEKDGTEHWVESAAIVLETRACYMP